MIKHVREATSLDAVGGVNEVHMVDTAKVNAYGLRAGI